MVVGSDPRFCNALGDVRNMGFSSASGSQKTGVYVKPKLYATVYITQTVPVIEGPASE